jgi:tRNA-dihydrouridine synthase B
VVKIGDIELGDKPLILAPMEDVTDSSFRVICKQFGADLMYTEFISSEGLIRDAFKSRRKLDFEEEERPMGIQIFGHLEESMIEAARVSRVENPNLIDINFGCPVKKVVNRGAGAAYLKDVPKMMQVTKAVVDSVDIPVTVKTRIGWDEESINIVEVALRMQDAGAKAIAIHGRTRSQQYTGQANWDEIAKVKAHPDLEIPVFGNGDITTPEKALAGFEHYGVDGVMIGRGAMAIHGFLLKQRH